MYKRVKLIFFEIFYLFGFLFNILAFKNCEVYPLNKKIWYKIFEREVKVLLNVSS